MRIISLDKANGCPLNIMLFAAYTFPHIHFLSVHLLFLKTASHVFHIQLPVLVTWHMCIRWTIDVFLTCQSTITTRGYHYGIILLYGG